MKKIINLPKSKFTNGSLIFESESGFEEAMRFGAFYLKMPIDIDHSYPLRLCESFYTESDDTSDLYHGHKSRSHKKSKLGYEDRPNQVEQLQIESKLWDEYFPNEVNISLKKMKQVTGGVLLNLFELSGVNCNDLEKISGGQVNLNDFETSLCYTTVNHYRSDIRNQIGIVEHTDSGFITTIYTNSEGYEVFHDNEWRSVPHVDGYYVVNLGDAFEILTKNLKCPGKAVFHRVPELPKGLARSSFTIYMGPSFNMDLFQYDRSSLELEVHDSFKQFSIAKAARMGYEFHKRV